MDVQGGKAHGACHMAVKIWDWVDALPSDCRPTLLRGDSAFGNEGYLCACEARTLSYLFKLKLSKKVQKLIGQLATSQKAHWQLAPGGWEVIDARLTLKGWSRERRIVVMRRPISSNALRPRQEPDWLPHLIEVEPTRPMEYAAVVCSAELLLESVPTLYAERGDCENVLDELKNQWGLSGFTTQDILRSKVAARLTALICNWWNVFARIAEPTAHMEAITSRAELLYVMALLIVHGGKKVLRFCSHHENAPHVKRIFGRLHTVFSRIDSIAGQLDRPTVWTLHLSIAFCVWLRGKALRMPAEAEIIVNELSPAPVPALG